MSKSADILVIDDEQVVRDGLKRVCGANGYSVDAVGDAASGIERITSHSYRLIVCDIMLPDHDGFFVLDAVNKARIGTPFIMITGCSTVQNAVTALKEGALDFIPKPFTVTELESAISRGMRYEDLYPGNLNSKEHDSIANPAVRECPSSYYRLGHRSWVQMEADGIARVGACDLFLRSISPCKAFTLFEIGTEVNQAAPCASVESADGLTHDVLSPVSGRIIARNDAVISDPSILLSDPYAAGWLYRILPVDVGYELNNLISCV